MSIVPSFCALCLLLAVGKFLRVKVKLFQKLYLPSAVIGGIIGLVVLQVAGDRIDPMWTAGWSQLPGFLINIVFAALFLGVTLPPLSSIWRRAAPQLAYGQIVAWGQYVVGLGLVLLVLGPLMGTNDLFGCMIPVGFEGGHGTAAGLAKKFEELGWAEGRDIGLASATVGIVSAVVFGVALINWAARKGHIDSLRRLEDLSPEEHAGLYPVDKRPSAGSQTSSPDSVESLALHLSVIGIAILVGYGIRAGLGAAEGAVLPESVKIFRGFPLFPLCMIGGLIVQLVLSRAAKVSPIDHTLMQRLAGLALDFLVIAALSCIRIEVVTQNWLPFVAIVTGGIVWNVFCVIWLAPRLLPNCWFQRAIAEMGQSMGVTATGLLLLRAVDPEQKTEAGSAFGYKQLMHEPFMGGGLWTTSAIILVAGVGGWLVFWISVGAIAAWLVVWALFLRPAGAGANA